MYTGLKTRDGTDITAQIHSYNGKTEMGFWNDHCDKVHGWDGISFKPLEVCSNSGLAASAIIDNFVGKE